MKKLPEVKTMAVDILFDIMGCGLFAVAVQCFSAPNDIAPGGVSGISILLNYLFDLPISILTMALNIPLLVLAFFLLGKAFTLRTLKTVTIMSIMLHFGSFLPSYTGNMILVALYGGLFEGIGLALIFMRGSTTGGSDVASRLIQLKFPHVSVGKLLMVVDGCVLVASAIVYRNIENAMYGLLAIFTSTRIIDSILYGLDLGKVMMIISNDHRKIADRVNTEMERGCTILEGRGSYTNESRPVLMIAVSRQQFFILKKIVYQVDPAAFVLALDATEIIGEGFKPMQI